MTFKYNNVYVNGYSTIVGPYEHNGPLKDYYDSYCENLYFKSKTWEQAEINMIKEGINILLDKTSKKIDEFDIRVGSDLLNQIVATTYSSINNNIPLIGVYSACASSCLSITLASNMIDANQINNALITSSSHNTSAEKQYRNPIEYGGPKKNYTTFTTTGCASLYLSSKKNIIKVESATIGKVIDMGIKDVNNMGAVMASAAADTIYTHLKDTNRDNNYYDLILTGDLGCVGKKILKEYMDKEYSIDLNNLDDCGCMIYDINKQEVYSGGSGIACLPLVAYSYIFKKLENKELKRVLLVATGALMNPTMCNQKLTIPSIAHAISLEAL